MLGRTFGRRFVGQGLRNTHGGPGHAYAPTVSVNESLFDPATFAATRRARDEARTLPSGCYTSPAWFAKETESIFARGWMLIGRGDEIAQPGAYLALDLPGVGPVFVTRAKDGSVRGFANVCRHRGARMLEEGRGVLKAGVVVCPYHAWTYDLTGALRGAPKMGRPAAGAGGPHAFCKSDFGLRPLRVETWGGFVFVNGAGGEGEEVGMRPLDESVGDAHSSLLHRWALDSLVSVGRAEYDVPCNWKFIFENTSETYHTAYVHRSSLGPMASHPVAEELGRPPRGEWNAIRVPTERSVVPLPGEEAPFPEVESATYFVSLYWCATQLNVTHDCAWWMRVLPRTAESTRVTLGFLFPRETAAAPGFAERLQPYLRRWDIAVREDNDISLNQQAGVGSALYAPGPYAPAEQGVHELHRWLLDRVIVG